MPPFPDVSALVSAMARREAAAQLNAAPFVPAGAVGPSVRVRLVGCPTCGVGERAMNWSPPFADRDGPLLRMLACETVTPRAVLPIVVGAEQSPELREVEFRTRAVTWLSLSGASDEEALTRVDAGERWVSDPDGATEPTLPASTRTHLPEVRWPQHRQVLFPHFLSPHAALPTTLDEQYVREYRSAIVHGYGQRTRRSP